MNASEIISQAIVENNPSSVFALYSGGDDSICSLHLAKQHPRFSGAVLVDTGIAVKETHAHAKNVCESLGVELFIYKSPDSYSEIVLENGFPGPDAHRWMYIRLKERAIDQLMRDYSGGKSRIVLITGQRKSESRRRMVNITTHTNRDGNRVWVAPMWEWSNQDKLDYMQANSLPANPVKPLIHVSGDCLCGAYADKGDLELLRLFIPDVYSEIIELQKKVMVKFPWAWDEEPPKWWKQYTKGQAFLSNEFMPLCWACERYSGKEAQQAPVADASPQPASEKA